MKPIEIGDLWASSLGAWLVIGKSGVTEEPWNVILMDDFAPTTWSGKGDFRYLGNLKSDVKWEKYRQEK